MGTPQSSEDPVAGDEEIPFREIAVGGRSGLGQHGSWEVSSAIARSFLFTDAGSWESFWDARSSGSSPRPALPLVDWDVEAVVVAELGVRATIHLVRCVGVQRHGEFVEVLMLEMGPGPEEPQLTAESSPWCAVAVGARLRGVHTIVRYLRPAWGPIPRRFLLGPQPPRV